jgi:hypothetical protein
MYSLPIYVCVCGLFNEAVDLSENVNIPGE